MKKYAWIPLSLLALALPAFAQSPITTMQYREMTRKHERMLAGTQSAPAISAAAGATNVVLSGYSCSYDPTNRTVTLTAD